MAHKKAGGSTKNGRDSNPKYLGVKINHGQTVRIGGIIVRQRGTDVMPGTNVRLGRDHTIYAIKDGLVDFRMKRKIHFDGSMHRKKVVSVK